METIERTKTCSTLWACPGNLDFALHTCVGEDRQLSVWISRVHDEAAEYLGRFLPDAERKVRESGPGLCARGQDEYQSIETRQFGTDGEEAARFIVRTQRGLDDPMEDFVIGHMLRTYAAYLAHPAENVPAWVQNIFALHGGVKGQQHEEETA